MAESSGGRFRMLVGPPDDHSKYQSEVGGKKQLFQDSSEVVRLFEAAYFQKSPREGGT